MKRAAALLTALAAAAPLCGRVYPQFGVEAFLGGRYRLFSLAPWGGLRFPLGDASSLIVKFRQQTIAFDYLTRDEVETRQKSSLSMATAVYYLQKGRIDAYAALFQMLGSDRYNATGADIGLAWKLFRGVGAETGLYLLNERSNLWYPDEELRRISLFVWHVGANVALMPRVELNPQLNFGNNSESVTTFAWSATLNWSPLEPMAVSLTFTRYSENEDYRYSGNYFSGGLNFYF